MAFNGSGTYVLPGAALVDGQTVSASEHNTLRNDMATAFTTCLTRDGQSPATANIPMGGFKFTGLAPGSGNGESVRYEQVIGVYAALAGSATQDFAVKKLTAADTITPNQTIGIVGTTTNNNAQAGSVGEVISSSVAFSSPVALTSGAAANVTSISLTAGDWDVVGFVGMLPGATTSITRLEGSISSTSATIDYSRHASRDMPAFVPGANLQSFAVPSTRISLAATTTIYLIANGVFTVSTLSAYGNITARRAR